MPTMFYGVLVPYATISGMTGAPATRMLSRPKPPSSGSTTDRASMDVTSMTDRRYTLAEVPDAVRYSETGRARGKIIVQVD